MSEQETVGHPLRNLVPALRASLMAKRARLLQRPLVARVDGGSAPDLDEEGPAAFRALLRGIAPDPNRRAWREDPEDGTCWVEVDVDYQETWKGREKEVLEALGSAVEGVVTLLTEEQRALLVRAPVEFLALSPPPETVELVSFHAENVGGSRRVTALQLAALPESRAHVRYVAIVPNLVQIERQLDALRQVEAALDDGPLAPLRALVGLRAGELEQAPSSVARSTLPGERLDEFQADCVWKALETPHFALIHGPPGSGKTTVISGIVRRAIARGDRVLVVSPTHVAVDNVVEKLAFALDTDAEVLELHSLPLRYAAKTKKLSERALEYWVGAKKQRRAATLSRRLERHLRLRMPFAEALYAKEDQSAEGRAPLSASLAQVEPILCGTPIGILSYEAVKSAAAGAFDLLVVDEVSKMTLPEFLAIAVKARRWVLVGDPEQLPPFSNAEENGVTLDDVLSPEVELVCSLGAVLERIGPRRLPEKRVVVVASDPARVTPAMSAHLAAVDLRASIGSDLVVVGPGDVVPTTGRESLWLYERGLADGPSKVEDRARGPAMIFETGFFTYHARPWTVRAEQRLEQLTYRNGIQKYLPSSAALAVLGDADPASATHMALQAIAERFAVNTVSVFDWLRGMPTTHLDIAPLAQLAQLEMRGLQAAVEPYTGALRKQYRMHSSLSQVPRKLFYFGEALLDGRPDDGLQCRVSFVPVQPKGPEGESNEEEARQVGDLLVSLGESPDQPRTSVMIITPYRKQEEVLKQVVEALQRQGKVPALDIEVCTLDRCQGREAAYVLVSLVRSRATPFLDLPKRWNVALTRAMEGLLIVGNVEAYLDEASRERRWARERNTTPRMSLIARFVEAYDHQLRIHRLARRPA